MKFKRVKIDYTSDTCFCMNIVVHAHHKDVTLSSFQSRYGKISSSGMSNYRQTTWNNQVLVF